MTPEYYIIILLVTFLVVYVFYYFLFNIFETTIKAAPNTLKSDNKSKTQITNKPINTLSKEIPFRSVYTAFKIIEGNNLIFIEYNNKKKGLLVLRAKDKPGKVKIEIISQYSLFPNIIEIVITKNI